MRKHMSRELLQVVDNLTVLNSDSMPGDVLRTPFSVISGAPTARANGRDHRLQIESWLTMTRSALQFDPGTRTVTAPGMWALVPSTCTTSQQMGKSRSNSGIKYSEIGERKNNWLCEFRNPNQSPSFEEDYINKAFQIRNDADRMTVLYDTFRRTYRRNPFITKIEKAGDSVNIHLNYSMLDQCIIPLERYYDQDYRSVSTPKAMAFTYIGLGDKNSQPTAIGSMPGYRGRWQLVSNPNIVEGRYMMRAMKQAFASYGILAHQSIGGAANVVAEQLLIEFALTVESFLVNQLDCGSFSEFMLSWPIFNRYMAYPSLGSFVADRNNPVAAHKLPRLADWLYAGYMFCRALRILKENGFESFIHPVSFQYSGTAIPDATTVEACFNVAHRIVNTAQPTNHEIGDTVYETSIHGLYSIFYFADNSSLYRGNSAVRLRLADLTYGRAMRWFIVSSLPPVVMMDDFVQVVADIPDVPQVDLQNVDYYGLNLNSNLRIGTSSEVWRTDMEDDEAVMMLHIGMWGEQSSEADIVRSLLSGGLPLFSADCYIPRFEQCGSLQRQVAPNHAPKRFKHDGKVYETDDDSSDTSSSDMRPDWTPTPLFLNFVRDRFVRVFPDVDPERVAEILDNITLEHIAENDLHDIEADELVGNIVNELDDDDRVADEANIDGE